MGLGANSITNLCPGELNYTLVWVDRVQSAPEQNKPTAHNVIMKHVTCLLMMVLLLCGLSGAEPAISVDGVSAQDYAQWLEEKDSLWTTELEQMRPFMPEQVKSLEQNLESIRHHARQIREQPGSEDVPRLKKETHLLVFSLEQKLEGLYVDLERASGPVVVLNF